MRTRLTIALLAATPFAAMLAQAPRAQTVNGAVVGITLPSGVKAFRGVPFADAPVRENRWRPPQPVKNWSGVRLADRFADQCMQARVFGDMNFRNPGMSAPSNAPSPAGHCSVPAAFPCRDSTPHRSVAVRISHF